MNMAKNSDVKTRKSCRGNCASDVATSNNMYMHMQTHGHVHVQAPAYVLAYVHVSKDVGAHAC